MTLLTFKRRSRSLAAVPPYAQPDIDACNAKAEATACTRPLRSRRSRKIFAEAGELALKGCATDSEPSARSST